MKTDGRRDEFMAGICTSVWSAARKLDVLGGIFGLYKSASIALWRFFSVLTALRTDVQSVGLLGFDDALDRRSGLAVALRCFTRFDSNVASVENSGCTRN